LHLVDSDYRKYVVFSKTKFSNAPRLKLKDYEDYQKYDREKDEFGILMAGFVVLNKRFDKTLDLFMISAFDQNLYASEKLIQKIKDSGITGLAIEDAVKHLQFE
jgi:hypothetical protein